MMKIRQLHQFVALAETLNFGRAARMLREAQPPFSVSIRKFEEELGAPLFVRDQRQVRLSAAGAAALSDARQALIFVERMKTAVRETARGERGHIRFGFVGTATVSLLPALLQQFREKYPEVEVLVEESSTLEVLSGVESGRMDAGIVRSPLLNPTSLEVHVLERDRFMVAVPLSSRFADRQSIRVQELKNEAFIGYPHTRAPNLQAVMMMMCQAAGFQPKVVQEVVQSQTLIALVGGGLGIGFIPSVAGHLAGARVRTIPIADSVPEISLNLVLRRETGNRALENLKTMALDLKDAGAFDLPD